MPPPSLCDCTPQVASMVDFSCHLCSSRLPTQLLLMLCHSGMYAYTTTTTVHVKK